MKCFEIADIGQKNEPWKLAIFYTEFGMSNYPKINKYQLSLKSSIKSIKFQSSMKFKF